MAKSNVPFLRSEHNYDTRAASRETALFCKDPSRAKQSMLAETDINEIMRRFGKTGVLPQSVRIPTYDDFTGVNDYQTALNAMIAADDSFMQMPADVRKRFHNDPAEFVEFCSNPDNLSEMRKLGLAVPEIEPSGDTAGTAAAAGKVDPPPAG